MKLRKVFARMKTEAPDLYREILDMAGCPLDAEFEAAAYYPGIAALVFEHARSCPKCAGRLQQSNPCTFLQAAAGIGDWQWQYLAKRLSRLPGVISSRQDLITDYYLKCLLWDLARYNPFLIRVSDADQDPVAVQPCRRFNARILANLARGFRKWATESTTSAKAGGALRHLLARFESLGHHRVSSSRRGHLEVLRSTMLFPSEGAEGTMLSEVVDLSRYPDGDAPCPCEQTRPSALLEEKQKAAVTRLAAEHLLSISMELLTVNDLRLRWENVAGTLVFARLRCQGDAGWDLLQHVTSCAPTARLEVQLLDVLVMRAALDHLQRHPRSDPARPVIEVHADTVARRDFVDLVRRLRDEYRVAPGAVCFAVLDAELLEAGARRRLHRISVGLEEQGIRFLSRRETKQAASAAGCEADADGSEACIP